MDSLQQDLDDAHPILNIDIVGINEVGHESANSLMVADSSLPWLQDVDADSDQSSDVWAESWGVTYRDVIVLDGSNSVVGTYNLTEHNLASSEDYSALRAMLIDAAMTEQKPWQNKTNRYDVNDDGFVVPRDVLFQVNSINDEGARVLAAPGGTEVPAYYDCNGDGWLSSIDVLQVINYMDEVRAAGEGPPAELTSPVQFALPHTPTEHATPSSSDETAASDLLSAPAHSAKAASLAPSPSASSVRIETSSARVRDEFWADYWIPESSLLETPEAVYS